VAHSVIPGETGYTYVDGVQNGPDYAAMASKASIRPFDGRELDLGVSLRFDTEYFPGQMDEVVFLNYAASEEEVNRLMEEPLSTIIAVDFKGKVTTTWGNIKAGH